MVGTDSVDVTVLDGLPQIFNVFARPNRRFHLRINSIGRVGVEQQVSDGYVAAEIYVGKDDRHFQRSIDGFAGGQVKQIYVHAICFVGCRCGVINDEYDLLRICEPCLQLLEQSESNAVCFVSE